MSFTPVSYVAPAREISILIGTAMGARLLAEGDGMRNLPRFGSQDGEEIEQIDLFHRLAKTSVQAVRVRIALTRSRALSRGGVHPAELRENSGLE